MKKAFLVITTCLMCVYGSAQGTDNTSSAMEDDGMGGFGGPLIRTTQIMDDWGFMIGGKGGAIINHNFAFGGLGMALVTEHKFQGDDLEGNEDRCLNLSMGLGGVFVQYIHKSDNLIQYSFPLHIMAGGVSVETHDGDEEEDEANVEVESSGIFILEPGVNVEFNVAEHFIPALHVSWRQVMGTSLENVSNQDVSGLNLGLIFKFGKF